MLMLLFRSPLSSRIKVIKDTTTIETAAYVSRYAQFGRRRQAVANRSVQPYDSGIELRQAETASHLYQDANY